MKNIVTGLIAFLIITMLPGACGNKNLSPDLNERSTETIAVKLANIQQTSSALTITSTGLLTTENEAACSFKIGGIIEKILVNEGQYFKWNQLLATLKTTEINAQLSQASLGYEKAERDYRRTSNLYKDSVATLEQLQNAKTGLEIAQKNVDLVAFNKKYAYIYANADGFVSRKIANEGEVVAAGMPVLVINEVNVANNWIVKVGLSDKEWAAIETGNIATVSIDAFPGKVFKGKVYRKSQAADQGSGSLQAEIKVPVAGAKPAIGMFAKVTIAAGASPALRIIPYDAVVEADGNNAFVFVPVNRRQVKKIPIVIDQFNNENIVVKSGLENIPAIIISNSAFLNEKSIITIIK